MTAQGNYSTVSKQISSSRIERKPRYELKRFEAAVAGNDVMTDHTGTKICPKFLSHWIAPFLASVWSLNPQAPLQTGTLRGNEILECFWRLFTVTFSRPPSS